MKRREINVQTGEETIIELTAEEVAIQEAKGVAADLEYNNYKSRRKEEYPTWQDQLDDIYHNGVEGWKATIKVVKDKYPKP